MTSPPALAQGPDDLAVVIALPASGSPRPLDRGTKRLAEHAERIQSLAGGAVCAQFEEPITAASAEAILGRTTRKLVVELRLDCEVAQWREGRGAVAFAIGAPADDLDIALDALRDRWRLGHHVVIRPADRERPVGACLVTNDVVEPQVLSALLAEYGLDVVAAYEVAACQR